MSKNKILLIVSVIAVIIIITAGVYVFFGANRENSGGEPASYGTDNPLQNKPDLNPVSKTNPFKELKTNPFE
ncbi:MAG: hypothetical protein AAB428_03425 [Patescibacteria group bacterium]